MFNLTSVSRICSILVFLGMFSFVNALYAHNDGNEKAIAKVSGQDRYAPTLVPDRVILSWCDDPATTMAVTWRTNLVPSTGYVEYAIAEDGPLFVNKTKRITAATVKFGEALYHTGKLSGLTPKMMYVYRAGDGVNWTEWNQFTTASTKSEPFEFVYFGDAQNDVRAMWSRVIRQAYSRSGRAAFMLHAGDLINKDTNDAEWGEWFEAGSHINRMIPAIATPGNHEYSNGKLSKHWRPTFAFPENGIKGLEESVYWIDYQDTRIISLNSMERCEEQAVWLDKVLKNNDNRWTILAFHFPLYASAAGRDNTALRELWQPIFDKYRVDLVLQGHDHVYARTGKMSHENVATGLQKENEAGTVYVVSVSGPKMYTVESRPFMSRMAEDTQLYQVIKVEYDQLRYEAHTANGRLYDAFTLRKRAGKSNELIEQIPDTPERLRK